jgi:hypothetical protein
MSAQSSNNDQPSAAEPASRPAGPGPSGHADPWSIAWASDAIRTVRSIGPLSSFASLGPRLRSRRPLVIAGITVVGLLGGAGAALATTGSVIRAVPSTAVAATPAPAPAPGPTPSPAGPGRVRHRGLGGLGFGGLAGLAGALHGQFVAGKAGGGYQTVDFQNGKVTAVSATSITLRSTDGYSHTYTIANSTIVDAERNGIGSVKVGHQASLSATVTGSTATAASIVDFTLLEQGRPALGDPGHGWISWASPPVASGSQAG